MSLSQSTSVRGDAWIPTYPAFDEGESYVINLENSSGSLSDVRQFWTRTAEVYEEKVFRGNSPLKLQKQHKEGTDLGTTTVMSSNAANELDGEPITVPLRPLIASPPRPLLIAAGRPPLAGASPNKWRDQLKSPPQQSSLVTPGKMPSDNTATIPILPSNANALWPPRSPQNDYQTPKPVLEPVSRDEPRPPASTFVPRYTPAPVPVEIVTETLVPLMDPPLPEDQYEMTEWEDSDVEEDEDMKERKRMSKRIPTWCIGWIETAKTQTTIDPDTVFGMRLPRCDLEVLFGQTNNAYMKARRGKRGSSGEWGMDEITRRELEEYRAIMGHTQQLDSVIRLI